MPVFVNAVESGTTDNICYITQDVCDALSLSPDKINGIRFGRCKSRIKLQVIPAGEEPAIIISSEIFLKLSIPEKLNTEMVVADHEIVLGPVLGVFVNSSYIGDLRKQTPRPSSLHMLKANEHSCLFIYFFTIEGADWLNYKVQGWYYSQISNTWVQKWLPLPNVVYDRGVGFHKNEKLLLRHYREQFSPAGSITRINSSDVLDKYWVYERIKNHENIKQYLPETIRYNSVEDVVAMLNKHKIVYLKSFYGSCGSEVMTVTGSNGGYKCSYFDSDHMKKVVVNGASGLQELIRGFFKDKSFIVQQGIDLLKYGGSRIDMRVLIQKNGEGKWISVYNVAIQGVRNSLITAGEEKGARFFNFTEFMPLVLNMSNQLVEELNNRIKEACIRIAKVIEQEYGPFGEIGMDMALDKNLKIWFIEANSKPDRELEPGIIGSARIRAICLNIIDYTKYLSGFC